MSEVYKTFEGGLFFCTFSIVSWIDVFIRREYQNILEDSIKYCQNNKGLQLYCYCIMPSHVHWIADSKEGKLSDILRDLKSFTAREIINNITNNSSESRKEWIIDQFQWHAKKSSQEQTYQVWKHDNHPFYLESNRLIDQKVEYIHQNPVKAGLVDEPWKWRLSSANPDSPIQVLDL